MTTENPNNFFDDLERQLVAATGDRPARLRRARTRRVATLCTVLVALLAAGGGIAAALSNTNNNGAGAPAGRPHTPAPAQTTDAGPIIRNGQIDLPAPGSFTVSVLNGTTVPGLGRGVANRLQNLHMKIGNVTNAPTPGHTTTTVYYARPDCIPAATEVAEALDLKDLTLKKLGLMNLLRAGKTADVVVVVGSDQNQTP